MNPFFGEFARACHQANVKAKDAPVMSSFFVHATKYVQRQIALGDFGMTMAYIIRVENVYAYLYSRDHGWATFDDWRSTILNEVSRHNLTPMPFTTNYFVSGEVQPRQAAQQFNDLVERLARRKDSGSPDLAI